MANRRRFLQASVGSAFALGLGSRGLALEDAPAALERRNERDGMRYRRLGRTGFHVSEIVMGGNEITPDNYEHVLMALDRGLNYLDTSPAYGKGLSEEGYARVIRARKRDTFFLNSKVSLWDGNRNDLYRKIFESLSEDRQAELLRAAAEEIETCGAAEADYLGNYFNAQRGELDAAALSNVMEREYGRRIDREKNYKQVILDSVDESLKRLGTDHLDLLMCPHGASSPQELLNFPEIFEAFEVLKRAGKVRHLGVSAHTDPARVLKAAVDSKAYSVAMVAYNVVNSAYVNDALAHAHANDLGVIAMKVARPVFPGPDRGLGNADGIARLEREIAGDWTVPQRAYLWALGNSNLSAAISNMVDAAQVEANVILPTARMG